MSPCLKYGNVQFFLPFFFNDTATTEIYTLSLHDALPISPGLSLPPTGPGGGRRRRHTGHGDTLPLATRWEGVRDRCAAARRGVARLLEIGGVCGRTPLCAYVPSRPPPPRGSPAAIRPTG